MSVATSVLFSNARPIIDVVVVCWNDRAKITTALDSVFALPEIRDDPHFARVVISDNGSSDGSREYLRERYGARIDIVENGANLGFAAACNRAFAATSAPFARARNIGHSPHALDRKNAPANVSNSPHDSWIVPS